MRERGTAHKGQTELTAASTGLKERFSGLRLINVTNSHFEVTADNTVVEDAVLNQGLGWGLSIVGSMNVHAKNVKSSFHSVSNVLVRDSYGSVLENITGDHSSIGLHYRNIRGIQNRVCPNNCTHQLLSSDFFQNERYGILIDSDHAVELGSPGGPVRAFNNGNEDAIPGEISGGLVSQGQVTVNNGWFGNRGGLPLLQDVGVWIINSLRDGVLVRSSANFLSCLVYGNQINQTRRSGVIENSQIIYPVITGSCVIDSNAGK